MDLRLTDKRPSSRAAARESGLPSPGASAFDCDEITFA